MLLCNIRFAVEYYVQLIKSRRKRMAARMDWGPEDANMRKNREIYWRVPKWWLGQSYKLVAVGSIPTPPTIFVKET